MLPTWSRQLPGIRSGSRMGEGPKCWAWRRGEVWVLQVLGGAALNGARASAFSLIRTYTHTISLLIQHIHGL